MIEQTPMYVIRTADESWRVGGTRVTLSSVVHAYLDGMAAEEIAGNFPSLNLERIHGALAFYLRNRAEVDACLLREDAEWEQGRRQTAALQTAALGRIRKLKSSA